MKVVDVEQKPIKCVHCSVRFNTKKNIGRHMKLNHSKAKPTRFQCVCCMKVYQTKGNYDVHYKKHVREHLMYMEPDEVTIRGKFSVAVVLVLCKILPKM